jgi:hypothetical protein
VSALIIRLPEDKRERLKLVAKAREVSVTKLIEEMARFLTGQGYRGANQRPANSQRNAVAESRSSTQQNSGSPQSLASHQRALAL